MTLLQPPLCLPVAAAVFWHLAGEEEWGGGQQQVEQGSYSSNLLVALLILRNINKWWLNSSSLVFLKKDHLRVPHTRYPSCIHVYNNAVAVAFALQWNLLSKATCGELWSLEVDAIVRFLGSKEPSDLLKSFMVPTVTTSENIIWFTKRLKDKLPNQTKVRFRLIRRW